jgi:hypothetical protein
MPSGPIRVVGKAAADRLMGLGPGRVRAAAAAAVTGAAAAVATYRLLRAGDD